MLKVIGVHGPAGCEPKDPTFSVDHRTDRSIEWHDIPSQGGRSVTEDETVSSGSQNRETGTVGSHEDQHDKDHDEQPKDHDEQPKDHDEQPKDHDEQPSLREGAATTTSGSGNPGTVPEVHESETAHDDDRPEATRSRLKERMKELNCFYRISKIMKATDASIQNVLERIIDCIPPAMQYPEHTFVRLTIDADTYLSSDFRDGTWKMQRNITVNSRQAGSLEVFYTEGIPPFIGSPFMFEEGKMIDSITEILEKFLEKIEIERVMEQQKQQLEQLMSKHTGTGSINDPDTQPGWKIMIDQFIKSDPSLLFRITRKMLYYLSRNQNESLETLMVGLNGVMGPDLGESEWRGINMPNPKKDVETLKGVQDMIFEIARTSLTDEMISSLLSLWLQQEKARPLVLISHQRSVPLVEVINVLNRFKKDVDREGFIPPEDEISIRTNLLRRFFTDKLEYINVAKRFVRIGHIINLLDRVVGPSRGGGKLGGKASGIFLAERIIEQAAEHDECLRDVGFARGWYLTSDCLFDFIQYNALDEVAHVKYIDPNELRASQPYLEQVFKNGAFPSDILDGLKRILRDIGDKPIIVRSSSLLEDSFGSAFSGKYKSLFLANTGTNEERLVALMDAIGEVYASVFAPDPIEYRRERGLLDFDEEMGIIIQEVVGTKVGPYFLPAFAGVAFSNNEFRWSPRIQREDGMIRLVAGLGTRAVDRVANNYPVLVSPNRPEIKVNPLVEERIQYSQQEADVINLEMGKPQTVELGSLLSQYGEEYPLLSQIVSLHTDGELKPPMGMLFDPATSDMIITFSGIIDKGPFIPQMKKILSILKERIGTPVDVEFAHDGTRLYILQCRPQSQSTVSGKVIVPKNIPNPKKIFSASKYVTTGEITNIEYIVWVKARAYDELQGIEDMKMVARLVGMLNNTLPRRRFILMGPGRWGSRGDMKLGVPVNYRDINRTSLLIEIGRKKGNQLPELSFGTHFFQDLVEAMIQYLPLYPEDGKNMFNEVLLDTAPNRLGELVSDHRGLDHVIKVIRVRDIADGGSLTVAMDGDSNEALAYLVAPDHSAWRMHKAEDIANELNPGKYGVVALYIFGSTNEGTAGPESDIDLLIHTRGSSDQNADLSAWLAEWDHRLVDENEKRVGVRMDYILDVHNVTDQDIANKSSWATHISSPHSAARRLL